jgi:hypothetical protein
MLLILRGADAGLKVCGSLSCRSEDRRTVGRRGTDGWHKHQLGLRVRVCVACPQNQGNSHTCNEQTVNRWSLAHDWLVGCQVRSVFLVSLIPCALSHALCSACALVSAAVLGRLTGLPFGVDMLITRDIRLAPGRMRWQAVSTSQADVALHGRPYDTAISPASMMRYSAIGA